MRIYLFFFRSHLWRWAASCVNMFRAQSPHEGYDVLLQMRDSMAGSKWGDVLAKQIRENPFKQTNHKDIAGPFFVLTTNVDTFFTRAGFKKEELCQTHGNYFEWQCGGLVREKHPFKFFNGPCHKATWPIPKDFQFDYDITNMTCPDGPPKNASSDWNANRPKCPKCGLYARPNVYQFGDQCFITNEYEENNSANWLHAVEQIVKRDPSAKVVFIELGVGQRLPKLRVIFERSQKDLPQGQCTIIRVNPEVKTESVTPQVIGLPVGGKEALTKIWGLVEKH